MMDALPLHDARRAGLKEGLAEGTKKKAIETVKNLLKMNLGSVKQIASATQLPVEEVLKIKNELK